VGIDLSLKSFWEASETLAKGKGRGAHIVSQAALVWGEGDGSTGHQV